MTLKTPNVTGWVDIDAALDRLHDSNRPADPASRNIDELLRHGVAFVTFNYGIDGVSIEISKYARCFERLLPRAGSATPIHLIGGNFLDSAGAVLKDRWRKFLIPDFDGWDKWNGGKWFARLFYEDMPEGSARSADLAVEIWRQAIKLADALSAYIRSHQIGILVPVNVNSNPGNLASALAVVITSELTGAWVLNSNHDFYWEGGAPASQRRKGEPPGVRDHFFKNCENRAFFRLFQRIFPWNSARWLQVNINSRQSRHLVERYGFNADRVAEVGTAIPDNFFAPCTPAQKVDKRRRMAFILSNGRPTISPVRVDHHLDQLDYWMKNQRPIVCGADDGCKLDIAGAPAIYFLQPTRVIARKRIQRDWHLIGRLLQHPPFRKAFEDDPSRALVLHITGPVPIEHQADLEQVLNAFRRVADGVPPHIAKRLFTAFSVGHEDHPALAEHGLEKLHIRDIYQMSDVVLFGSEEEGRGLPLIEAAATGVPIVSSRYHPEEVFADVVGENLPPELRIQYTLFPEGRFTKKVLDEITELILAPQRYTRRRDENRRAVEARYSTDALKNTFHDLLHRLFGVRKVPNPERA